MEPLSHSIQGAQERLKFGSRQTVYNEINSGRLRSYKVGSRRFISEEPFQISRYRGQLLPCWAVLL